MECYQNALDIAMDKIDRGLWTVDQANVEIVCMMGVRVITNSLDRSVRSALNKAVKSGKLGHIKKDGLKPEVYFHANGRSNAIEERDRIFKSKLKRLLKIYTN